MELQVSCVANVIAVYNKWHETELERWLSDHGTFSASVMSLAQADSV